MSARIIVNDWLHETLGYAENAVVDFVVAKARDAKEPSQLTRDLEQLGVANAGPLVEVSEAGREEKRKKKK